MQNINAGHLTFLLAVRHDVVLIILFFLKHAKNEFKLAYFTWQTNVGAHADAAGSGNERDSKKSGGKNRKKSKKKKNPERDQLLRIVSEFIKVRSSFSLCKF